VELAARNVETVNGRILGFALNRVPKKELGTAVYGYGGKPHPEQR
jgi:hypothetical protein